MSHFAVIAPPLRGHYRPLSHLADALIERGHRVTFIHQQEARAFVDSRRSGFAAVGHGSPTVESWTRPMAKIQGLLGLGKTIRRMETFTHLLCAEAPLLLRDLKVDAVIADQLEPAGGLVAESMGLPWISTATSLPMNRELAIPPPFVPWVHDPSPAGLKWNEGGWKVTDILMSGFNRAIAREAEALGLPPRRRMEDCFSPLLQIAQAVPGLDWPRIELPNHFHYVGPLRPIHAEAFELADDDRPTAYCTLGTLQGSRIAMFRKIAAACDANAIRLVLTHGGLAGGLRSEDLPGRPLVYDWIPQEAALAQVDLAISHAGMNTVLEPLANGIPMVVMPLALEQPAIAARVKASGAGIALSRFVSAGKLSKAIARLREDPPFTRRAKALQQEILQAGGTSRAADLIERALGLSPPPEAATRARAAQDDVHGDGRSGNS